MAARRLWRKLLLMVLVVVCVVIVSSLRFYNASFVDLHGGSPPSGHGGGISAVGCAPWMNSLRSSELDLSNIITLARHCIKPAWTDSPNRFGLTSINLDLLEPSTTVDLTSCRPAQPPPCQTVPLSLGFPDPTRQYSHLVFAVSTVNERMRDSLPQFSHWLSGTGAIFVAVVNDVPPEEEEALLSLEQLYLEHGIKLKATMPSTTGISADVNHFAMVATALDVASRATRWLVLLDDDTFFPSLHNLDETLQKYDHKRAVWLGALSEDQEAVARWGRMAFGGAGVFLSVPLARQLKPHIGSCIKAARLRTGDGILRDCITDYTNATLSVVAGLRQHDLHGDVSGFYESGARPLSVHHWRSWYKEPIPKMAAITAVCGDCFLQRWQFGKYSLLANGYSITHYPKGIAKYNFTLMEGTWDQADTSFNSSLGLLRPRLGPEEKTTYKLVDSRKSNDGQTMIQVYLWRGDQMGGKKDAVIELNWPIPPPKE